MELDLIGDYKTAVFIIISDTDDTYAEFQGENHGDITTLKNVDPSNIEKMIYKYYFKQQDKSSELGWGDLTYIIHIIDLDGAYVADDCIREFTAEEMSLANSLVTKGKGKDTLYMGDHIAVRPESNNSKPPSVLKMIDRNSRKRKNVEYLLSIDEITVGKKTVKYEQVVNAIVDQYLKKQPDRQKGLVNIWADVPYQDLFWLGNIRELEKLISELGLTPNTIFGYKRGIDNINKIPEAEFNLLVSPWVGLSSMKKMERKLGIPYLHYKTLPIGATETSKFLREVGKFAGVAEEKVEAVIKEHEDYYYYLIERYADLFLENRVINKQFSVVADAQYALGITKFLVNDLGLVPAKQFVVDDTPQNYREQIAEEFKQLNYGIKAEVSFETDGYKIHDEIKNHDYHGYPLILGGYYEKEVTENLKGNFLNISWPVQDKVVFDSFYVGYAGGIRLIEDIYTVAVSRFN